jgi:hypothetical protein
MNVTFHVEQPRTLGGEALVVVTKIQQPTLN